MYLKKLLILATVACLTFSFAGCDIPGLSNDDSKTEEKKDDEKKDDEKKDDEKNDENKDNEAKDGDVKGEKEKEYTQKDGVIENDYYKVTLTDGWELDEHGSNSKVSLSLAGNGFGIYMFPHTTETPKKAAERQAKAFKKEKYKIKETKINGKKACYFKTDALGTFLYVTAKKGCTYYKLNPGTISDKEIIKQLEKIEVKF